MIPLFKPYIASDVADFVVPVLHSGYIGEGEQTKLFERRFGELIRNDNVVVVNSGTSAITLALKLAEVGYGDRVISTPESCLATNMAILSVGAVPVWADILPDGTIDPIDVQNKLTDDIKAIVCMDWGGKPCKLNELMCLGPPVIEDACQALGATYNEYPIGNHCDFVCFSFQSIKYLTTVDGGALAINTSHELYTKSIVNEAKTMRWFGLDRTKGADMRCNQDPPVAGYKWQMNDVLASIGLANMGSLYDRLSIVRRNAEIYNKRLGYCTDSTRTSSYWLYTIFMEDVDGFIQYMKENGVECSRVHDRNDTKTVFSASRTPLPGVDWFDAHHVCIPVGWWVSEKEAEMISEIISNFPGP